MQNIYLCFNQLMGIMEVTIKINTSTSTGRRLLNNLKRYPNDVFFENPATSGETPRGYLRSDEFWELQRLKTEKFCKENGIL